MFGSSTFSASLSSSSPFDLETRILSWTQSEAFQDSTESSTVFDQVLFVFARTPRLLTVRARLSRVYLFNLSLKLCP